MKYIEFKVQLAVQDNVKKSDIKKLTVEIEEFIEEDDKVSEMLNGMILAKVTKQYETKIDYPDMRSGTNSSEFVNDWLMQAKMQIRDHDVTEYEDK